MLLTVGKAFLSPPLSCHSRLKRQTVNTCRRSHWSIQVKLPELKRTALTVGYKNHLPLCFCRHNTNSSIPAVRDFWSGFWKMMKRRMTSFAATSPYGKDVMSSSKVDEEVEWEMRPGGMLVQKRVDNKSNEVVTAPNLRLRVAFGGLRYEISASSQSTFGELKKILTAETGLQAADQRLIFRGKERENGDYLDMCGVKDRSKVMLIEDPASIERRAIEMRRSAKIQTAHRAISDVCTEIDRLEEQVSAIEKSISNGVKVAEVQITTLIEMLMRQAIKLDNISAEGDAAAQKSLQSKRVQKCVETLDVMKVANSKVKPVVVTTRWETFDPPRATANWELFD